MLYAVVVFGDIGGDGGDGGAGGAEGDALFVLDRTMSVTPPTQARGGVDGKSISFPFPPPPPGRRPGGSGPHRESRYPHNTISNRLQATPFLSPEFELAITSARFPACMIYGRIRLATGFGRRLLAVSDRLTCDDDADEKDKRKASILRMRIACACFCAWEACGGVYFANEDGSKWIIRE